VLKCPRPGFVSPEDFSFAPAAGAIHVLKSLYQTVFSLFVAHRSDCSSSLFSPPFQIAKEEPRILLANVKASACAILCSSFGRLRELSTLQSVPTHLRLLPPHGVLLFARAISFAQGGGSESVLVACHVLHSPPFRYRPPITNPRLYFFWDPRFLRQNFLSTARISFPPLRAV